MGTAPPPEAKLREVWSIYLANNKNAAATARQMGNMSVSTLKDWVARARPICEGGTSPPTNDQAPQAAPPPLQAEPPPRRHLFIPDTQIRPGVPTDHIDWIGQAIVDYAPDVVIVAGDWWDFPSLNSHNQPGSVPLENARYQADLDAGNLAFARLCAPMEREQAKPGNTWFPRKVFLMGNHEHRADRVAMNDPKWMGHVGSNNCQVRDFEWHPFLKRVEIDGIYYAHFFPNQHSSHAIGGSVDNRLNKIGASFTQGHEQGRRDGQRITGSGATWYGLVAGSCLTPDHKVLTADLRYVPLGEIAAGERLVSFDENTGTDGKRSRRYVTGTVEAVARDYAEVFEVTLENGKVFKVTGDHLWLTRRQGTTTGWMTTEQLLPRDSAGRATHVPILLDEWEPGNSYDTGWLAGLYDGEGCLYERETTGGKCSQLTLSQKEGVVLERARLLLTDILGQESITHRYERAASTLYIKGGRTNIARTLGVVRPSRLLPKWRPEHLGRVNVTRWVAVASVKPLGSREIVRIAIDAKTMIVEGYGHHNCYLHTEDYRGPNNRHWRGIVVKNEVENGEYDAMFLSLRYLCRKFEGVTLPRYMAAKYPDGEWSHLL
jgi:hypothetical protein